MKKDFLTSAFERLHDRLLSRAHRVVNDDDETCDILQEAFCRLWASRKHIEESGRADGMIIKTVDNLSIDSYRHTKHFAKTPDLADAADRPSDDEDSENRRQLLDDVNSIIATRLTQRDREILLLRDRDEWEFEEIAGEYGLTAANVRLIVARARRTVRDIYRQQTSN